MIFYSIIEAIFCLFLIIPFLSVIISLFIRYGKLSKTDLAISYDFACIITAYKDAHIAENLIKSLLDQKYKHFKIYLVADDCDISGLHFSQENVSILKPETPLKSKVKSIIYAIDSFTRNHSAIMIFDPDNLAHSDCLQEINYYLNQGFKAVQGRRTAKNLDTYYACIDALGEFYYNYTQRLVPFKLGSSATIAGSGMAFLTEDYLRFLNSEAIKSYHQENKVIVAEDKILQVDFVKHGNRIAYAREAIIYDEKVSSGDQVERQRTRWINSYFLHLKDGLGLLGRGFTNFNFNQLYFAYTIIIPPMFIQVGVILLFLAINVFYSWIHLFFIFGSLSIFVFNFLFVIYLSKVPVQIWKSIWAIPLFVFKQVFALLKMKRSNKDFLVTEKRNNISLEEVKNQ
jgi:cellulose synthase/poly-beta-1,6-N-acetylglucosamine synthase-like glycosyltransferase